MKIATQHPLTATQQKTRNVKPRGKMTVGSTCTASKPWSEARKVSERVTRLSYIRSRKSDALFPNFSGCYPLNIRQDIHRPAV